MWVGCIRGQKLLFDFVKMHVQKEEGVMKKRFLSCICVMFWLMSAGIVQRVEAACTQEQELINNKYVGACGVSSVQTFNLGQSAFVTRIRVWHNTNISGTTPPSVTITGPSGYSFSGSTTKGLCDVYQTNWCEAWVSLNQDLAPGSYTLSIPTSSICTDPSGNTTLVVYGCYASLSPVSNVSLEFLLPNGSSFHTDETVRIGLTVWGGAPDTTAAIYLKYLQASNSWVSLWNSYLSVNGIFFEPTPILPLLLPVTTYNLDCHHSPCFLEFSAGLLGEGQHSFEAFLGGLPGPSAVSQISNVASVSFDIHAPTPQPPTPQPMQYTISASVNPVSAGSISCNPNPVSAGSTSSCSITANSGYSIESVTGTCGGALSGNVFTTNAVSSNCTVVANLIQQPTAGSFLVGNWTAERMSSSVFIGSGPWSFNSDGSFLYNEQGQYYRHVFKGTWSYANGRLSYRYEEKTGYDSTGQVIRHCVTTTWPNASCDVGTPSTDTFYSGSATVSAGAKSFTATQTDGYSVYFMQ